MAEAANARVSTSDLQLQGQTGDHSVVVGCVVSSKTVDLQRLKSHRPSFLNCEDKTDLVRDPIFLKCLVELLGKVLAGMLVRQPGSESRSVNRHTNFYDVNSLNEIENETPQIPAAFKRHNDPQE